MVARAKAGPLDRRVEPDAQITVLTDLSEWIGPDTIREWIEDEIDHLSEVGLQTEQFPWSQRDCPSKTMLAVLSFAYLTGVFSHEDIAARCYSNPTFHLLCEGRVPVAQELSSFRRRNRHLLERILAGVLLRAVRQKSEIDLAWLESEVAEELRHRAAERLDLARHMNSGD